MTQLALFSGDELVDPRELPQIIAANNHFPLQHYEVEGGNLYAVQDWIRGVAQTDNPRRFWADVKKRAKKAGIELSASCVQLPYTAADGKSYKVDFADAETLYLITQRMDVNTGLRNRILAFLAKAGVEVDRRRRMQAHDPLWLKSRQETKHDRKELTGAFSIHVIDATPLHYAQATDAVYEGLYDGRKAKVLKQQMGLEAKANLRDYQTRQALNLQGLVEATAADLIAQRGMQTPDQALETVHRIAEMFGVQARQISQMLGIDIATGRPLLESAAS